jgi:membrane protease YdiL (CAAX protease family)
VRVQAVYALLAAALVAFAGIAGPPPRLPQPAAAAVGLAAAVLLCALLGRDRDSPPRSLLVPALIAGASEEVVWRWGVLAGLAPRVGWGAAFGLSTAGFAYRHTRGEELPAYLLLGGAFGGVFLATGRLAAAIAAHAAYNALAILRADR